MKFKQIVLIVFISVTSAMAGLWAYNKFFNPQLVVVGSSEHGIPANYAGFFDGKSAVPAEGAVDLTKAASTAVPAVVHIKTKIPARKLTNDMPRRRSNNGMFDDFFDDLFGGGGPNIIPEQRASGSGVLISEDGYIVTNNHVISDGENGGGIADEITVTLHNKKVYKARVIGRDPSSDIAVLKIDGNKFPFLLYGNSTNIQLGQWVLAIGYPLTLETTVTAGIVSATGRTIGINGRQTREAPVESFIQTDAAVNQGNSGGALVNTNGELIGINSAILAPTGTYAGYSFAIPVTIIKKIVNDIIQFGNVQRGYLGISFLETDQMSEDQLKREGIPSNIEGVYVSGVTTDGGAIAAGIKKGDIITKVNGSAVYSGIEMSAQIASFRPGDNVAVAYMRNGKEYTTQVQLKKTSGTIRDIATANIGSRLGADLSTLTREKAKQLNIDGGVIVNKIKEGGPISRTRIAEGFVITSINGQSVSSVEELAKILGNATGPVKLDGIYPGYDGSYTYPLNLE